jgi:hypothetical protein
MRVHTGPSDARQACGAPEVEGKLSHIVAQLGDFGLFLDARLAGRWRRLPQQGLHDPGWIRAKNAGNGDEFDNVDAALAGLILGHERLRLPEPPRDIMLGQASLAASGYQKPAEGPLVGRMDGLADTAGACSHRRGKLSPTWDYPKSG